MQSSSAMTTSTTTTMPQTPSTPSVRLGTFEQFAIGISSGMLAASGLSSLNWFLVVVVLPCFGLELWDFLQLTFSTPDVAAMKQIKHLRLQQFGYGVISGSAVSNLVTDLILRPSMFTLLDVILYSVLLFGWASFWSLPSLHKMTQNLESMTDRLETALQSKESDSACKKRKRALARRHHKKISLPLGDNTRLPPSRSSSFSSSA